MLRGGGFASRDRTVSSMKRYKFTRPELAELSLMEMNFEERMVQESEAAAVFNDEPTLAVQGTGKGKFLPTAVTVVPEYTAISKLVRITSMCL
jgi:hypothetical protein